MRGERDVRADGVRGDGKRGQGLGAHGDGPENVRAKEIVVNNIQRDIGFDINVNFSKSFMSKLFYRLWRHNTIVLLGTKLIIKRTFILSIN